MMRVLHVIGAMDRGGAETMIMNLYRAIDRSLIQFDFVVHESRACDYDEEIQDLGGRLYRGMPRYSGLNQRLYRRLWRRFFSEHEEYLVVHGHIASSAAVYLREAKRAGCTTIAHSHAQNYPLSVSELGFRTLTYPIRFVADQFLACSEEAGQDRFGEKIVRGDSFHVVRNAIDVEAYACDAAAHRLAREAFGFPDDSLIGHVGRFDPVKNHQFLIEVFAEVVQRNPRARLVLVGRGPVESDVRTYVQEAGLSDRVEFYGVTDRVPDVLKAIDAFVFTSFSEGLSMAAVEAQAAGVPSVLSRGVPDLAIVAPQLVRRLALEAGPAVWADAVMDAFANPGDRVSGATGARACGYDIADTVRWLESYYLGLRR